jgi:long-chain acyl-CoA synthetase
MMPNLSAILTEAAAIYPDRVAVREGEQHLTYTELDARAGSVATLAASLGIRPGDRVAMMLPNVIAFPIVYFGLLRAGAIVVPMNPLLAPREVSHYLSDSGAKVLFSSAPRDVDDTVEVVVVTDELGQFDGFAPTYGATRAADSDTAVILYTSGTTGSPKGAELTHEGLRRNAALTATDLLELSADDVIMGCLPLFHVFGQTCGLNAAICAGAAISLLPRFDPATVLTIIARDRVTVFEGVPTMYVALNGQPPADTSSLRVCISGGAALPVEVLTEFEKNYGCEVLEGYGLSETSPVASFNLRGERRPGSIGRPVDGVQMAIVDNVDQLLGPDEVGEVVIRGHNVMTGYWNRPEATAQALRNGWFHSGDVGRFDQAGYFYIVDRKKDMIIRGGFNVYPREIEEVLYEHPDVVEAAVIGVAHPTHGEEVAAAVVTRPGSPVSADELRSFVKARVAPYKYPRRVWLTDALPKGPTGKIVKRDIVVPEEA